MREQRKYQMKKHPWLFRLLLLLSLLCFIASMNALRLQERKDALYLGILTIVLLIALFACRRFNHRVHDQHMIHLRDLDREVRSRINHDIN